MQKRLSIKAIAKDLCISPTTVSFILNDKALDKRISQALIDKVKDHINKIGYHPNQLAKNLRTGQSKMIVLMVEDISTPFFAAIAKVIEQLAYKKGYTLIYCSTGDDPEKTRELLQQFSDLRIEGYILSPPLGLDPLEINQLIKNGDAVVLFGLQLPEVECCRVKLDHLQSTDLGMQLALRLTQLLFGLIEKPEVRENHHVQLSAVIKEKEFIGQPVNLP
ncbi:MAG TPA: LacI family DNA-binding transcriptional regulator [Cyclobacteriaceae bacterium]|nr:LacI family DNA-binding transcriptional regulator [Cyclobacteriaceae bacterium]